MTDWFGGVQYRFTAGRVDSENVDDQHCTNQFSSYEIHCDQPLSSVWNEMVHVHYRLYLVGGFKHFSIYGMTSFPLTNSIIFQDGEIAPPTSIQRFPTMVDPQATMCRHRFLQYGPMYDDIVGGMWCSAILGFPLDGWKSMNHSPWIPLVNADVVGK